MIDCSKEINGGAPTVRSGALIVGPTVLAMDSYSNMRDFMGDHKILKAELLAMLRYCRDQRCISDKAQRFCPGCKLNPTEHAAGSSDGAKSQAEALGLSVSAWARKKLVDAP